jgi:hypothetical protein
VASFGQQRANLFGEQSLSFGTLVGRLRSQRRGDD